MPKKGGEWSLAIGNRLSCLVPVIEVPCNLWNPTTVDV